MKEIITRSGITPVGSSKYRINRLRYHLLAYSISRRAKLDGQSSKYIIRCDDTNAENTNRSFLDAYLDVLNKIGVCPDIGPYERDESGHSLFQSERTDIYQTYIQQLVRDGLAYLDATGATLFDTSMFEKQFRHLIPDGKLQVSDISMGKLSIDIRTSLNDGSGQMGLVPFPLTRSNGSPLFNIASPVDDALLGVTHVVRDRDKLSLLHNQEMVRIALGFRELKYVHAPFIVDNVGKRLVYDDYYGEATYQDFIAHGILSKALVSYLLSTITGPSEKFYDSIDDFTKSANFTNIHKANTTFTPAVLEKHNKKAIEACTEQEYELALQNYLDLFDTKASQLLIANRDIVCLLFKSRRSFVESARIIKGILEPQYDQIQPRSQELIYSLLNKFSEAPTEVDFSVDNLLDEKAIDLFKVQKKEYFQAARYILTGEYHGCDLHEIIKYLFEKGLIKQRLETAKRQILDFKIESESTRREIN
ncbi:MAG: glutamate--tRNA ligase family protein [Patescibacteria group bacterium]